MLKPDALMRDEITRLTAYQVANSAGMVKLDAMENPYGLPSDLRAEIAALAADASLNRYPDPAAVNVARYLPVVVDVSHGDWLCQLVFAPKTCR